MRPWKHHSLRLWVAGASLFLAGECSRLGTKTHVQNPEALRRITSVALAPVPVDGLTLSHCSDARSFAAAGLDRQVRALGRWSILESDSLVGFVGGDSLAGDPRWLAAARAAGVDAVLFCALESETVEVTSQEPSGWSCDLREQTIEQEQQLVTKTSWLGPIALVRIVDVTTGQTVAESKFNVHWGKSYWQNPPCDRLIEDTIAGALAPIGKAGSP